MHLASVYRLEAVNFWKSAEILSATFPAGSDVSPGSIAAIPFYLLISHAAKLLLKSALLKRGFTEDDLKAYRHRHSLAELLQELEGKGVSVSPESVTLIKGLHSQHQNHALRYTALVDDGQKTYMPPPVLVFAMLEELLLLTRISTQGI